MARARARLAGSAVVLVLAAASGCVDTRVGPNMAGLDVPVLVGPVHRIGGGKEALGRKVVTLEGTACRTFGAVSGQPGGTASTDDVASGIRSAAAGIPGCVVTVRDLKAVDHYHISLFAWSSQYVWVESVVWSPVGDGVSR